MLRERLRRALRALIEDEPSHVDEELVTEASGNVEFVTTSLGNLLGDANAGAIDDFAVPADCNLYVTVADADTWKLPLAKGTRLRFSVEDVDWQYNDLRGCARREN